MERESARFSRELDLGHVERETFRTFGQLQARSLGNEPNIAGNQVVQGTSEFLPSDAFEQEDPEASKVLGERIVEGRRADVEHRVKRDPQIVVRMAHHGAPTAARLASIDLQQAYERFQELFTQRPRPKDLRQAKEIADWLIDQPSQENALRSGLGVLGYPPETSEKIAARWHSKGRSPVREFAPYFAHVLAVDLTFYIGLAADLISRDRPSNLIDVAYVHYLPFCSVFVSSDKLHARMVPLFLKPHQRFVEGTELKADLGRIYEHYAALPIEVRRRGVSTFGEYPPGDESSLVSKLWDLSLPGWRERLAAPAPERDPAKDAELIAKVGRFVDAPMAETSPYMHLEEADLVVIQRFVKPTRGKWLRFPPEALRREDPKDGG